MYTTSVMKTAEAVLFILLAGLIARPTLLGGLSNATGKMLLLVVVVYTARLNAMLGLLSAVLLIRVVHREPEFQVRPPRIDRLGLDTLLRPQESFFRPTVHSPELSNDPVEKYTPF